MDNNQTTLNRKKSNKESIYATLSIVPAIISWPFAVITWLFSNYGSPFTAGFLFVIEVLLYIVSIVFVIKYIKLETDDAFLASKVIVATISIIIEIISTAAVIFAIYGLIMSQYL